MYYASNVHKGGYTLWSTTIPQLSAVWLAITYYFIYQNPPM